jgi:hypothetical protein
MEKMYVDVENFDRANFEAKLSSDAEAIRSRAGTVSYLCKVYRTRLDQCVNSHSSQSSVSMPSRGRVGTSAQA